MFHVEHFENYKISDKSFENYLTMNCYSVFGMFYVEHLIGYVIFLVNEESADVVFIGTRSDYGRKGIASKLLNVPRGTFSKTTNQNNLNCSTWNNFKNEIANSKMFHVEHFRIFIEVSINNSLAVNFYKKNGFQIVNTRKAYSNGIDSYLMMKKF